MKSVPGGARYTPAPQASGMGRISPLQSDLYYNNSYANTYGPFLPRESSVFTNGAFSPASPILPTPIDEAPPGGLYPDPRWWQYRQAWNLPTPPGTEGLKLASFDQLRTLAQKYSVARACIDLRQQEIRGLEWSISLTTEAAKAYRTNSPTSDREAMRDFGERKAKFVRFFSRPDPDFWNFDSFLNAVLEEIFVYDALAVIFRPKFGASFGMGGRGLLGSDLDSLNLVSGPTIRPLIDLHGGHPKPPAPAYQQFLYGVPRSDYMTIAMETDISEAGLEGAEVNEFTSDVLLYAPYWTSRESPYGFPPVERALLPIISGLQKQQFQLDYFTQGTIPAVYISPGDTNISPTQIGELQNALNALAGDPAYHQKVVVLPPGSRVEPQRPVDLSDSFDYLVMNQVCMEFDVQPQELGIIPNVGQTNVGPSASGIRFAGQEARDIKNRKSTKPLLKFLCGIFNHVIQDICGQRDMRFVFEGLVDDEDKQAITQLGVEQVQNGISSIDEVRERLDLPPWGLEETSEPVVFTQQGPVPFSMAPQLIQAAMMGNQQQQSSSSSSSKKKSGSKKSKNSQPSVSGTGPRKPNGSHPAPSAPGRTSLTPAHAAASAQVQRPVKGRTGGSAGRSPVAGSRKRGDARTPTQGRLRNKTAALAEKDALKRHLRKGRAITTWEPAHIPNRMLGMVAEDIAKGVLIDVAVDRAFDITVSEMVDWDDTGTVKAEFGAQWPGWHKDLTLVAEHRANISQAFQDAEIKGRQIRQDAAMGKMFVSSATLAGLVSDATRDTFLAAMTPMWTEAWNLGYSSARQLVKSHLGMDRQSESQFALEAFLGTEGSHWLEQVSRTGLGNSDARSELIARTEVARAMNAGAMQCYKEFGVSHKHLLVAPDDACDVCDAAKAQGVIPLDAIFPSGGLSGPFHPNCRCVPAPAGIEVEPPAAHVKVAQGDADTVPSLAIRGEVPKGGFPSGGTAHKSGSEPIEDEHRLGWLLLRATDEDGKYRFLLQQRSDGSWGMPGGKLHVDEDPWTGAVREVTEEIGDLPMLGQARAFHHVEDDGETQVFLWMVDVPFFNPRMNGDTPEETMGVAWFRRGEIDDLDLAGKFREDWKTGIRLEDNVKKALQNAVNENGERAVLGSGNSERNGAGMGARWPYPHRADGENAPEMHWPDAGPGRALTAEPPNVQNDLSDRTTATVYPRGSEDEKHPRRRGRPPRPDRFPSVDGDYGMWPQGGHGDEPEPEMGVPVGGGKGMGGPSRRTGFRTGPKSPTEVPVAPETPHPYEPHAVTPVVMAPDANEELVGEEGDSPIHHILPVHTKGAEHVTDANPVEWRHVYSQMEGNFPSDKLGWVKRARWTGPVNVPWGRIDDDDIDSWAASHQPEKVNSFVKSMKDDNRSVPPSILVQEPKSNRAFIVDGHHRALAHRKLGQPVLAYVGNISPRDRLAAEETHSSQIHQGSDPQNKSDSPKG